jgi:hypothetical protein
MTSGKGGGMGETECHSTLCLLVSLSVLPINAKVPYLRMYRPHMFLHKIQEENGVRLIFEITLHFI